MQDGIYSNFCECTTYQKTIFPGLVLRPQQSPIVLLIFSSGRIVCTGGRSYNDMSMGFDKIFRVLKGFIHTPPVGEAATAADVDPDGARSRKRRRAAPASAS